MKTFSFIKKSLMILSILPLLSLANLHADDSGVAERAGEHRAAGMHHESAGHHDLHRGLEGHGYGNRAAFNRGAEAGAAVGGGAGAAAPVYIEGQQPVQYVTPQPLPPQ